MKKIKILILVSTTCLITACSQDYRRSSAGEYQAAQANIDRLNQAPAYSTVPAPSVISASRPVNRIPAVDPDVINIQDELSVSVFKVPDLSGQKLIVEPSGNISLPLVGAVRVHGLSIVQAEQAIRAKLSTYMHDPKVTITRTDKAVSKRVTVEGEVRTPGVFPIKGNLSFLQAIALAQGVTELADSKNVLFYRDGRQYPVNLELVRQGQLADPVLRGDDRIIVLRDKNKELKRDIKDYLPTILSPFSLFQ